MEAGVLRREQGVTRDISQKGMFIHSNTMPPAKADLEVDVAFRDVARVPTSLRLRARSLVIRVEPASVRQSVQGFAILNKSYELQGDVNSVRNSERVGP
jgi:hypothetical protein